MHASSAHEPQAGALGLVDAPARLGEVARTAGVAAAEVAAVADVFRSPDRSFLIPPAGVPLEDDSVVETPASTGSGGGLRQRSSPRTRQKVSTQAAR